MIKQKCAKLALTGLAALLLGGLLPFAFAPYGIYPLAIIAPAGLLALLLNTSPKKAFWLGFLFGFGLFGIGVCWVFISIHRFGDVPDILAGIMTAALAAVLALFPASACYLTSRFYPNTNTRKLVYAFPAIWIFIEWVRCWLATGFPWLLIGYSQTHSPLKGYAPILSVYGVSLAVMMSSGLILNALLAWKQKNYRSIYRNLFGFICIWIIGGLLSLIPWTQPIGTPISVSIVQGNIPQSLKWTPDYLQHSVDTYVQLSEPFWKKDNYIIWPEAAIPVPLQDAATFVEDMDVKAKSAGSHLILGIPIQEGKDYYNAVITLGSGIADHAYRTYRKRHLVPFGEYVPFKTISAHVFDFLKIPMSNLIPGELSQQPLNINGIKFLTSICYEIAFPELSNTGDKTVGLILTVTDDAWFGDSAARAQHLQMGEMRAIELGRPVIFSSNNGITAIIGPKGRIASSAPTNQAYVLNGTVQPMFGLTPWMRNGTDPIIVILLLLLFVAKRDQNGRTI